MDLGLNLPKGRTRRIDANVNSLTAVQYCAAAVDEASKASVMLSRINFDAREFTPEHSATILHETIELAQVIKKKWIEARQELDDVLMSLDFFIARCHQDKKRYEGEDGS